MENSVRQSTSRLETKISTFVFEEAGATTVEYAFMLALIIGGCIVAINFLGLETFSTWSSNANEIGTAMEP